MKAQQDKSKTIARLRKALGKIPELEQQSTDSTDFEKWKRSTEVAIERSFGDKSRHTNDFSGIYWFSPTIALRGYDRQNDDREWYLKGLASATALLESMIDEVEEYWSDDELSTLVSPSVEPNTSREVFVIHGRDEGTRDAVARFLQQLKLEPVILAEQANQGKTIIEKFESHAQVRFAVALLTPDDTGSLGSENAPLPRARQNVIFELGFFIGRLGRKRVCALTKGEVEIPSDYSGVVYIPLDDKDGWRFPLVKELKAAGIEVDANLAV